MKTYLNQISGIDDAIVSMFMSKRSWTREKELHIREVCRTVLRADGGLREYDSAQADAFAEFADWMDKLTKWGWKHTTMLRYMLSIPSNFIFKIDLTEWGHVFKERNANGSANPEVKQCCESIADQVEQFHKQFNRELFLKILN